jgi:suppressor of fused protein SUFU
VADEVSPGGSEIFRHQARERDIEFALADEMLLNAVAGHLERTYGAHDGRVFHELVSDLVHVDVHLIPATGERDWITLLTSGMAQRPMAVPDGLEEYRYAELMLALPSDWRITETDDETSYWPIRLLKFLARLPHEYDTFLCVGHTIPNDDPPQPYTDGTGLCGALIAPPQIAPEGFERFETPDGRVVYVYALILLHRAEMDFKLKRGADALGDRLEEAGVTELVDLARASVVGPRRRFFGRG